MRGRPGREGVQGAEGDQGGRGPQGSAGGEVRRNPGPINYDLDFSGTHGSNFLHKTSKIALNQQDSRIFFKKNKFTDNKENSVLYWLVKETKLT